MTITRDDIVRAARGFVGTPYHHQGRLPGVGMDCAGVPICIGRALGMVSDTFDVPTYKSQPDGVTLLAWCREHMRQIDPNDAQAGDMVLTRMERDPQHLCILANYRDTGKFSIIHASNVVHPPRVIETPLLYSRWFRFVAAFAFPGVD